MIADCMDRFWKVYLPEYVTDILWFPLTRAGKKAKKMTLNQLNSLYETALHEHGQQTRGQTLRVQMHHTLFKYILRF